MEVNQNNNEFENNQENTSVSETEQPNQEIAEEQNSLEEKKVENNEPNKTINILLIVFMVISLLLASYIIYDKAIKKDVPPKDNEVKENNDTEEKVSKLDVGTYVGGKAKNDEGKEVSAYTLYLREDGSFLLETVGFCGDGYVGKYSYDNGKLKLEETVYYGCDACYYTESSNNGIKLKTYYAEVKDNETVEVDFDGKVVELKKDATIVESSSSISRYVTNPTNGLTPNGWGDPWTDCTNMSEGNQNTANDTKLEVGTYVGGKAKNDEGKEVSAYTLYLRKDGSFLLRFVGACGDGYVGNYSYENGKLKLEETVYYGCDACYYTKNNSNGIKLKTYYAEVKDSKTMTVNFDGKVVELKKDATKVESNSSLAYYLTKPSSEAVNCDLPERERAQSTKLDVGTYVGGKATNDEGKEVSAYTLYLREDGSFLLETVGFCGDGYVGKYSYEDGKLKLEETVYYGCDACYYTESSNNGIKLKTYYAEVKDSKTMTVNFDGKVVELKKDATKVESSSSISRYVTNPTNGLTPNGWGDPWIDCTNMDRR